MNIDNIVSRVRNGEEIFVPVSEHSGLTAKSVGGAKVAKASVLDFIGAAAKRKVRKSNPIAPNQADYVNWIIYDRISYAAAAVIPQQFSLFVAPIGSGTKTKVDTNLRAVSSLTAPQWFNCTGISLQFNPNVAPIDLSGFFSTEYMEFWVGDKVYAEGPIDVFPASGGMVNQTALGTMVAAATSYITNSNNGQPNVMNQFDTRLAPGLQLGQSNGGLVVADGLIGITIPQSQTFYMNFKADGGGTTLAAANAVPIAGVGITVMARLYGVLSRGVQ